MYKEYKNVAIVKITPEKILTKKTSKGEDYLSVVDNRVWYNCFDRKLFGHFFEKQAVMCQVAHEGKFKNIVGIENDIIEDEQIDKPFEEVKQERIDKAIADKNENIIHLNAINNAVQIVTQLTKPSTPEDIESEIKLWVDKIKSLK